LERAPAECLGEGKGLAVMGGGLIGIEGILMRVNLPKEPEGPRLASPFPAVTGKIKSLPGKRHRVRQATGQHIALAQPGDPKRREVPSAHGILLHCLLQ
jgi:hypothetical protein